jgi:hypothetical protein
MSDDLVKQLRIASGDACRCGTPVCLEAADRIKKLEAALVRSFEKMMEDGRRVEKLEDALKEILSLGSWGANDLARTVAREALEGTCDPLDGENKR